MIHPLIWSLCLLLSGALLQAQPVDPAQLAANPEEAGVKFNLDTFTLLKNDEIFTTSVSGPVWIANANANFGKTLIQVPILLEPGQKPVEIDSNLLKLGRGTFVCFRMNDFGETAGLLEQAAADNREFQAGAARLAEKADTLETAIPVLTKKFTLLPNGRVQYAVTTVNPRFCEILPYSAGDSLYKLKLDAKMRNDLRPPAPDRPTDRSREAQLGYQAAFRAYQQASSEYRDMAKKASGLEKDLEIVKPTRIWMIFEVDQTISELSFAGMKPLPWELKVENLAMLRDIITKPATGEAGLDGVTRLDLEHTQIILNLAKLIEKRHPYDLQLASLVVNLTHMVRFANLGDTQFFLLKAILESEDSMARQFIMAEMSQTFPPTLVTIELTKLMVRTGVGTVADKRDAIKSMLEAVNSDPTQATSTAETINTMLANEDGPAPSQLLGAIFKPARENVNVRNTFVQSIRFQSLPEKRFNDALVFVVENAGAEPLAAGWLNEHFLGSANLIVLKKTLTVISEADTGARDLGPMFNWAVNKLFGHPASDSGQLLRKARMRLPIPINTPYDGIYRALQHGNEQIRTLAWRSLPRFIIPELAADVAPLPESSDRYQILTNTALDMLSTPPGVVTFLERQPNKKRVAECLIQIVLRGSSQVQIAGVRALIGCKAPLGAVMLNMSPGERQGFAMVVYEIGANQTPPPMVVNVLRRRDVNNPVARWFGDEVAKGQIPSTTAWVGQFDGEGQLLELVASNDDPLAKGAAAVMLTAIGGTDRDALTFREKVRTLSDQTAAFVAQTWQDTKLQLFANQLKRYEGNYRLSLFVGEGDNFGGQLDIPMREIPVGIVQFRINEADKTLTLTNEKIEPAIGDAYHTIRIGKPAEIKSFPSEELAQIPLEKVTTPVQLRLQDDGTWKGTFTIGDGAQIIQAYLLLSPAKASSPAAVAPGA